MRFNKVLLKQENDKDCGKSALRMLLSYVHNSEYYLTLAVEGGSDNFLSIKKIAERHGVTLTGKKLTAVSEIKALKQPFIAQTSDGGVNHFVVGVIKGGKLLINDPSGESYSFVLKKLTKLLFTNILIVESFSREKALPARKIKYRTEAFVWEILFVALIGVGFLFMGSDDLTLISYISFTLAALAKIVEQQVMLKSLAQFDEAYIKPLIVAQKEMNKKDFVAIQNAKQIAFSLPIQLFSRLLSVLLVTIVLAYNNYYLLVICLLTIVGALFLTKTTLSKTAAEWDLKKVETKLFSKSNEVRADNYKQVTAETNKLAKKQIYYSVIALLPWRPLSFF